MDRLERYAELIVRVGVNLQPGQTLFVNAQVEHLELVRALAKAGYRAGARYVDVRYADQHVRRAMIEHAADEVLTDTPAWIVELATATGDGGALVMVAGDPYPELFADLDQERVGRTRPKAMLDALHKAQTARTLSWTIAAFPNEGWAEQVFGEPDVERLWEAIAETVRLDEDDPVAAWRRHVERLQSAVPPARRARPRQRALHAAREPTSPSACSPRSAGRAAASQPSPASSTSPNMPTEEVFTAPDWRRTEGTVRATRPLALGGTVVRDLELSFERGEVVDVRATSGADAVRGQLSVDEYAGRLGEVALVDGTSRVGQTGLTFFNTLFDENATCHIAYGTAVVFGAERARGPRARRAARARCERLQHPHRLHDRRPRGRRRRHHARRPDGAAHPGGHVAAPELDERLERYAEPSP